MAKVTERNTKAQIFSAYEELLVEHEQLKRKLNEANKKPAAKPEAAASSSSSKQFDNVDAIIESLGDLRGSLGEAFSSLQQDLTGKATRLQSILTEMKSISAEMSSLYGVDLDQTSLADLIHQYNAESETFEERLSTRREEFEAEIKKKRDAWSEEKTARRAATRERDAEAKKVRQREQEEFDYQLAQARQLEREQDAAAKKAREDELAAFQEGKRKGWAQREDELAAREAEFAKLKADIESFEAQLEDAKKQATEQGASVARRDAKQEADLKAKEYEGQRRLYKLRIDTLQQKSDKQEAQISDLDKQLAAAQVQAQELVVKTVEGASGSSSFEAIREIAMEQARQKSK